MVTSPVIGLLVAFLLMNLLLLLVFRWAPAPVNRTFRLLQPVSAWPSPSPTAPTTPRRRWA